MNNNTRKEIALKSDDQLREDIARYQKRHGSIPIIMANTRQSSNQRLQAHIDEQQSRLLALYKRTVK